MPTLSRALAIQMTRLEWTGRGWDLKRIQTSLKIQSIVRLPPPHLLRVCHTLIKPIDLAFARLQVLKNKAACQNGGETESVTFYQK